MKNKHLTTYLNDHLSGSVAALQLISYIQNIHPDTELKTFLIQLEADIKADQQQLESFMERWSIAKSSPRQLAAWLAEKVMQAKLLMDDSSNGPLALLEIMEALSLGIEGKRLLWCSLEGLVDDVDFALLKQRADDQRRTVEQFRLKAAREAIW